MEQAKIFQDEPGSATLWKGIGNGLFIERDENDSNRVTLYRRDIPIKKVDLGDKVQKRLFVVEMVEIGATQTLLAEALGISRQSIHNWMETKKHFGLEGLIHGYSVAKSKNIEKQRKIHADKRPMGNKAEILAKMRKEKLERDSAKQLQLDFNFGPDRSPETIDKSLEPFVEEHDLEFSRYAGVFCRLVALQSVWKWFRLIVGHYGSAYRIFLVFVLMAAKNVRSVEQLKNVRKREAGTVLGIGSLPSKPVVRQWFYDASEKLKSLHLLEDFFNFQIKSGLVSLIRWFADGHLLPYTGRDRVHCGFNTQRRMPEPGRTNIVTCDQNGRVALFDIQEGKGDLKETILETGKRFSRELPACPTMVFDREGYDADFFFEMVENEIPFATWQKNVDKSELESFGEECWTTRFEFNGKEYAVFEKDKVFTVKREEKEIDNEGKNLFDFVTSSVWNAGKLVVDWLSCSYDDERDVVDLFYAIANSHGWIKSTSTHVVVELEPLEQPKRRLAQEQLCRKLTSLGAITPTGKAMVVRVAENHRRKPKVSKN